MENSTPTTKEFALTRQFAAPRALVFQALTEADRLARWWGPKDFAMVSAKVDLRPGGLFHYQMLSPEGHVMWGRFAYREIVAPERIVFTNSFSDAAGGVTRAPFSPTWPLEVLNTLTLTEAAGLTTVTLRGGPVNATPEERRTFEGHFTSMQQGFGGTFDQLAAYLAKL